MRTSNLAIDAGTSQATSVDRVTVLRSRAKASLRPERGLREVASLPHPTARAAYEARSAWREVLRDLGIAPESLARNVAPHGECSWVRGIIDVATGKAKVEQRDFSLGSASAFVFDRAWISSSTYAGPLGHGWHHVYDVALSCRSDTVALRMPDGRVSWFTAPEAGGEAFDSTEQLRLSRDAYGFRLRDARGCELRFVPHRSQHAHVLCSMRELYGCELRFAYDHRARLVRISGRGDCDLELQYDRADRVLSICAAGAERGAKRVTVAQYGYDARGNLTQVADALGQSRGYGYEKHLITAWTDRSGAATRFEWDGPDSRARCVEMSVGQAGPMGNGAFVRRFDYAARSTRVRNSLGREVRFIHDGAVVCNIESACERVRDIVRGEGRRVERDVNSLGRAVTREYDAWGRLTRQRAPDGATWTFERDACGRIVRAIDPLAGCWQLTYDSRGRVLSRTDPLGRVTRYQYRGRWLVSVIKPGDRRVRLAYDGAGHLESRTEPGGQVVSCTYDAWGRVIGVQAPHSASQERQYDSVGRLVRVRDGERGARELGYDAEGRLVRWKDPFRDVRFTYQGGGLLSSRTEAGSTVCFDYDAEEQLIAIVNEAGAVFQIARDASGAIVETTGFDGCKRRYVRDGLGRIARVERAGAFSEYEYDAANRPIEVHHSDGAFEGFRYRVDGALMAGWNQEHTLTFERDRCGQVLRENDGEHYVASELDAGSRRTQVESSFGTHQAFERDAAGRIQRVVERTTGFELRIERDARGLVSARASSAGRCTWEHDAAGRPTAVRYEDAAGNVLRELSYAWDGVDRLMRCTDSAGEGAEYGYDPRGNLTWRKTELGIHQRRVLSPTGELFQREDRRDREYGAAGQLLVRSGRSGEITYRYDEAGRLIERCEPSPASGDRARWSFSWSASGLLRRVLRPDGTEVAFGYDALGRRIWKKYRGQTTRFVWDGMCLLHEWVEGALQPLAAAEFEAAAGAVEPRELALRAMLAADLHERGCAAAPITWMYDPDSGYPIAKLADAAVFAVWVDLNGAPVELRAPGGQPLWAAEVGLTGELRDVRGARHACLLRRASLYEDLETGLYCECRAGVPARYFDPVAGAYVCQGALASAPTLRPYSVSFDSGVEWSEREPRGTLAHARLERSGLSGSSIDLSGADGDVFAGFVAAAHIERRIGAESLDVAPALQPHPADSVVLRATDTAPVWAASPRSIAAPLELDSAFEVARTPFNPTKVGPQPQPLLSR